MLRTNLYFPKELHQRLKRLAKQEDISMAELVRQLVEKGVKEKQKKMSGVETLLAMAKHAGDSGIGDLAINHDKYLYGKKRT
jgi:predicted DNA-binding protein